MDGKQREQLINELKIELARREYKSYVEYAHEGRWVHGRAVDYICDRVQAFIERKTDKPYEILILSMPPQHGKSMTITETLPSWYLGKNVNDRVIEISYSEDFAQLFGRKNKQKIEQFGKSVFNIELAKSPNSNTEFELSNNVGSMISRGVMSGVTGRPCNLMIIDDPIKNRLEADSQTYRDRIKGEWNDSFKTRLYAGAKVILIQTRWHEDDLAGYIIQNEKNVEVINLPCEAEDNDPLGRNKGEALAPEIGKDTHWKDEFKQGYITQEGQRTWLALFQGRPTAQEGNLIKRSWWQYYKKEELPELPLVCMSVDATFKDNPDNDFVAIQVWGKSGINYYLIDRIKEKLDFPKTILAIERMHKRYPQIKHIFIEDKANGSAIISTLQKTMLGIIPVKPEGGKIARANAVSYIIEGGNVYLPSEAEWVEEFVDEWSKFPNSEHDDEVDAGTQALNRMRIYWAEVEKPNKAKVKWTEDMYEDYRNGTEDIKRMMELEYGLPY